ncbi:Stp1/IreP family PP2C-type Ser/Thr phosphatase [Bacillus salitolerans]|uniref:Stp1/IreP family PP2C-type Ser/Thr phosphatase n=1 Tax=Bacillus salitolerans TaxID=1437434 RepID=A0ABW4LL28_9BACI
MNTFFLTDRGKVRQNNEDNGGVFQNLDGQTLTIVADGMGGHRAGDVASTMTVEAFKQFWCEAESITTPETAEKWIQEHVNLVNESLYHHSIQHDECEGMGTTLVLAICHDEFITIAHVGDSRCYIVKENSLTQVTEDHSLVNELVRHGQISKEDAEYHPRKNVLLRVLGTERNVQVDIKTITTDDVQYLLLCSDGLSNKVTSGELLSHIENDGTLEEIGTNLVMKANEYGGEDNITIVLVDFDRSFAESGDHDDR